MNPETQNLISRIEALEKWQAERMAQQIVFPLDIRSRKVLNQYYMHITDVVETIGGAGGNTFINYIGSQGNYDFQVDQDTFIPYTVDISTNYLAITGKPVFDNGQQIYVSTSDSTPTYQPAGAGPPPVAPLVTGVAYFVVNVLPSGQQFQIALTSGGVPLDFVTAGVGRQYLFYF